jgi:hypothetical protein
MAIAGLYNYVIASNPINAYTDYFAHGDMDGRLFTSFIGESICM